MPSSNQRTPLLVPVFLLVASALLPAAPPAADLLAGARRVVFLGDSITHGGHYVTVLEAALRDTHPDTEFINLGLPSEGVTGLSEPAHPFPRPNVHERLDRVLKKADPDLVVACYGINDGIYHPFSKERFDAYQQGIGVLADKIRAHGAKLILVTPPPFDPLPVRRRNKLRPADAKAFSWKEIYENYDREVVRVYADWIVRQTDRVTSVVDVHRPISRHVAEARKQNPDYALSGDGIHLDKTGHRLMAEEIHRVLTGRPLPDIKPEALALAERRQALLKPAWLAHVGHKRPGMKAGLPLAEAQAQAASLRESR